MTARRSRLYVEILLLVALLARLLVLGLNAPTTILPKPFLDGCGDDLSCHHRTTRPPYWPRYGGAREVFLLDGRDWWMLQIRSEEELRSFDSMDPNFRPSALDSLQANWNSDASSFPWVPAEVPGTVDAAPPGQLGYRGVSFFRRKFRYDLQSSPARVQFQACSFYCRVWINDVEIGHHLAGGYVAFWLDVPRQDRRQRRGRRRKPRRGDDAMVDDENMNEIFVLVDNRFNSTTAPMHTGGDFWHYGGIARSVEWHRMPPQQPAGRSNELGEGGNLTSAIQEQRQLPWPWRCYVVPVDSLADINISCHLTATGLTAPNLEVELRFDDVQSEVFLVRGDAVDGVLELGCLPVPHPRIWSPNDPQLHAVQVILNGASVTERFGLRRIGQQHDECGSGGATNLTVNGEVLKLKGWNHHTQWPGKTGASPTDEQLDADLALLTEGGANFVRGAHYPQDPRWLDRLDESGLIMWSETLGPNVSLRDLQDSVFMGYQTQQIREMLDSAMNHPSIAVWGYFNEGPSDQALACPAYRQCADAIRDRDPAGSRFITYASHKRLDDVCLDAVSMVSFNTYPGWYSKAEPHRYWNHVAAELASGSVPGAHGKPFVISETGAGGIYEWSDNNTAVKWTLAYQSKVVGADVDEALSNGNVSGIALWHLMDFKVDDRWENGTQCDYLPDVYPPICSYINTSSFRPGGLNHKGSVDFWRREKPVYRLVAAKYKNGTGDATSCIGRDRHDLHKIDT